MNYLLQFIYKTGLSSILLMALPVSVALALIPEPATLVYGTVKLDDVQLTAADSNISIVLFSGDTEVTSYTLGASAQVGDQYLLEIPMDSVSDQNKNAYRIGDSLQLRYRIGATDTVVADLVLAERGTDIERNLDLHSAVIDAALDPDTVDTDSDGIPDSVETTLGMNPLDPADVAQDIDGDGVSNLQEYRNQTNIAFDDYPPVIIAPEDKIFNSTGLFTEVDLGVADAVDALDGELTATPDGEGFYAPGNHTVTWTVSDAAGNTATDTQEIVVVPQVNFSQNQLAGEGGTVTLVAMLNGAAGEYPVVIPYTVTGTATNGDDYTLSDGDITIASGLNGSLEFSVNTDADDAEEIETIIITMGTPVNAVVGDITEFVASIIFENIAPSITLIANQSSDNTSIVISNSEPVTIMSMVVDPNPGDTHIYDWSQSDAILIDIDGDVSDTQFIFDASGVPAGLYTLSLTVTDSSAAVGITELVLHVIEEAPVLSTTDTDGDGISDEDEGLGDSDGDGIANYLDGINLANVIQAVAETSDEFLVETVSSLRISLGAIAFLSDGTDVRIDNSDIDSFYNGLISTTDGNFTTPGGIFDFTLSGLSEDGEAVSTVIPQFSAIPKSAEYRQFVFPTVGWTGFTVDENNKVYSAAGAQGYCPKANAAEYTLGLTAGHWCVQLLIQDGGPNDTDGQSNKVINSTSAVAVVVAAEKASTGSGGSSSLLLLGFIFGVIITTRRKYSIDVV